MEFTGRFITAAKDYRTGLWQLTFQCNELAAIEQVDKIKDLDLLDIKAEKHRVKRGRNSNAYAWTLMQRIAEAVCSDKWTIYLQMLQRYSRAFTHVIVKPEAVQAVMEQYRTAIDLGEISVNGQIWHQLQVYFGSSTFDSKEMSVFIDGIISECKELGIETLTPAAVQEMNAMWENYKSKGDKL